MKLNAPVATTPKIKDWADVARRNLAESVWKLMEKNAEKKNKWEKRGS